MTDTEFLVLCIPTIVLFAWVMGLTFAYDRLKRHVKDREIDHDFFQYSGQHKELREGIERDIGDATAVRFPGDVERPVAEVTKDLCGILGVTYEAPSAARLVVNSKRGKTDTRA